MVLCGCSICVKSSSSNVRGSRAVDSQYFHKVGQRELSRPPNLPSPFTSRAAFCFCPRHVIFFERFSLAHREHRATPIPRDRTGPLSPPLLCRKQRRRQEQFMTRGGRGGGHGRAALPQGEAVRLPLRPMDRREAGLAARGAATTGGGCVGWGTTTNTGRRLAGQRRRRPARGGSSSSALLFPKAVASSLAVLAFLADPAASFQVRRWGCCSPCAHGVDEP